MPVFTKFKGITDIGDMSTSEIISDNLITFIDWGLLDIGAFFNVTLGDLGAYGGSKDNLRLANDPNFNNGQVWESFHKNWIWQSGTTQGNPISISGVYVNDTFHETASVGTFAHHYDYPNGRVVFDSAISTTSTVELEYSYKWIDVTSARNIPFFRRVQPNANRLDSDHFGQIGSGDWDSAGFTRVQLPTIAVEVPPISDTSPHSLGTGWNNATHTIKLHILAEDDATAVRLADILVRQNDRTIYMFDTNEIASSGAFPLDFQGMVVAGAKTFPGLVDTNENGGFRWNKLRFKEGKATNGEWLHNNLYLTTVRIETEVVLTDI